ncbi:PREDICTED: cecropin-C-like [Nicrophorus vespilloides]|uniref:Cecropin-C-like n=1 Tax=Nicrophorus vespilloides TaxID=110193 RepID=A0ABM1M617_NICVS|nr:PREDICTED: cecropin-C-like [Nicrophorus vespilloides]
MNLKVIFVFALVVIAALMGQAEAGSKRWRKFEKKFKHAAHKVKEALPVIQGYAAVAGTVAALGRK